MIIAATIQNAFSYFMNNLGYVTYGTLEAGLLYTVVFVQKNLRYTVLFDVLS